MFSVQKGIGLHNSQNERAHQRHALKQLKTRGAPRFRKRLGFDQKVYHAVVIRRSVMISDIRLKAISLASGDSVVGEAATIADGRGCGSMSSGRSMPRYPYKSASARARARLDRSDVLYAREEMETGISRGPDVRSVYVKKGGTYRNSGSVGQTGQVP